MPAIIKIASRGARGQGAGKIVKVIPEVDLKILDPVWTTATISTTHGWLVYDTLFATDGKLKVQPQMVEKYDLDDDGLTWHFKLRDGLGWHDGTPVTAKDCVASIRRWAARFGEAKIMMDRTEKLDAVDDKTFVLKLKEPFGPVIETLGNTSQVCFMMRSKEASSIPSPRSRTSSAPAPSSSSPRNGSRAPRSSTARTPTTSRAPSRRAAMPAARSFMSTASSGTVIPDPAVATNALITGEMDYWTNPAANNVPQLKAAENMTVVPLDPLGWQLHVRMNSLAKPFDNPKARQGLQMLVESRQEDYLTATGFTGDSARSALPRSPAARPTRPWSAPTASRNTIPRRSRRCSRRAGTTASRSSSWIRATSPISISSRKCSARR